MGTVGRGQHVLKWLSQSEPWSAGEEKGGGAINTPKP